MKPRRNIFRKTRPALAGLALLGLLLAAGSPRPAHAQCIDTCCGLVVAVHEETRAIIRAEHDHQRQEVFGTSYGIVPFRTILEPPPGFFRLRHHEKWLVHTYFEEYIQPAMMLMTEQLAAVMMEQMLIIGTFFDAEQQLKTQLAFQQLAARAHKDYHPSFGMCEFGTNSRSLAAADFNGDLSVMTLNKRFMDRQLGNGGSVGAAGPDLDRASEDLSQSPTPHNRLGYFLQNTCDDNDLNKVANNQQTGLIICRSNSPREGWVNRDIDWNNTIMSPRTINVDFAEEETSDNSRLLEMSNYLYGHRVFTRPDGTLLEISANQDNYLDARSVIAKRSVAQNSFNSIVGLKSRGTKQQDPGNPREISSENTSEHMRFFLVELGFPEDDAAMYHKYMFHKDPERDERLMDDERDQISYYAQMEMLAKKIYQRPEFYTELYDKPANVQRKSAAMQAIKLMLDRDIFDSQLRAEAIMSMILELKVVEEQQNIENKFGLVRERVR